MAAITRRMAISSSHRILKEYQKKIVSVMADKDKVYLPLAGQQIVNRYKNDADGYKKLLDAAAESTDFFLGMQDDILVQYNNICNKLNKVFELNVADSKEIDGFVNEKYIIQSQKETVTGIRTVPLYSFVKYQLVNEAGEMPLASECSIEWEAEDIEHHFSKTINTLEAAGENVTDFFDNKFSNPFDRTFCSIKEGRYIIKAKIHDKNDEIIDVIEFEQIVETKDKDIESMDFVKKILLALQSVKWEKEPDYKALADALFFSAAVIIAINVIALIPVIGQGLAGAIVFAIMVKFRINCTLNVLKGIFKIAEALILIDRAKSRRAITVGGQKLQEGIQYLGNGLAGFILMKFTARNLAEARLQVLEKTPALPPPALPAGGASAVPATTGSALPALTATSQEVAVALNNSAVMAMETVNQMSVTPAMKTEIADIAEKPLIPKSKVGKTGEGIPLEKVNPKVLEQIQYDENGAYGYLPRKGTAYDSPRYDFTNVDWAKGERLLRIDYLKATKALEEVISKMRSNGVSNEAIAKYVVEARNQQKVEIRARMKPEEVTELETRNMKKYGNPVGPDEKWLFEYNMKKMIMEGKAVEPDDVWEMVIEGSMRKDDVINTLLGLTY